MGKKKQMQEKKSVNLYVSSITCNAHTGDDVTSNVVTTS